MALGGAERVGADTGDAVVDGEAGVADRFGECAAELEFDSLGDVESGRVDARPIGASLLHGLWGERRFNVEERQRLTSPMNQFLDWQRCGVCLADWRQDEQERCEEAG